VDSFTDALSTVFLIAAAVVALAFLLAWLLEERPLRQTVDGSDVSDTFAPPQDTDSLRELTRALSRCVGRDRTRRFVAGVVEDAQLDLEPAEAWLMGRVEDGRVPADALEVADPAAAQALAGGLERLHERGLVSEDGRLTGSGADVRAKLLSARERRLRALVDDWVPESADLDEMISRLAVELERDRGPVPAG
jgi:hypothetical protein